MLCAWVRIKRVHPVSHSKIFPGSLMTVGGNRFPSSSSKTCWMQAAEGSGKSVTLEAAALPLGPAVSPIKCDIKCDMLNEIPDPLEIVS